MSDIYFDDETDSRQKVTVSLLKNSSNNIVLTVRGYFTNRLIGRLCIPLDEANELCHSIYQAMEH